MWAGRSLLRRSHAAVLSQLHAVRRHANEPPVVVGGAAALRVASGRRDDAAAAAAAKQGAASAGRDPELCRNRQKKHLYLVLDDAKSGAGIHKIDMDDPNDGGAASTLPQRLPDPPLVRIDYSTADDFAVLGRHVVGMGARIMESTHNDRGDGDTVTFDTRTSALAVLPDLPDGIRTGNATAAVAVGGDRLYVIEHGSSSLGSHYYCDDVDDEYCVGGLHCLRLQEDEDEDEDEKKPISKRSREEEDWWWDWYNFDNYDADGDYSTARRRWLWSKSHRRLPLSPYGVMGRAQALHPRGRAFFISVWCQFTCGDQGRGTFSYETESARWTRHGDWELPFVGQGHYHAGLRAWVGLHGDKRFFRPDGYLCACDVPRLGGSGAPPAWKLGKEKLFRRHPERHVDAKLVYMSGGGGGGRFCLVEILTREGVSREERVGDGHKCVLRLTTFGVEYGDDGELITTDRRPARSYEISCHKCVFHWQAFWA